MSHLSNIWPASLWSSNCLCSLYLWKRVTALRGFVFHPWKGKHDLQPCLAGICESNTWLAGLKLFYPLLASLLPTVYPGYSDKATFSLWYSFDAHVLIILHSQQNTLQEIVTYAYSNTFPCKPTFKFASSTRFRPGRPSLCINEPWSQTTPPPVPFRQINKTVFLDEINKGKQSSLVFKKLMRP